MNDENVKSVRYPAAVDEKFVKLALKLGRTKRQLFIQMVDYFYKSKKDPADLNDEVLKRALSSGIHRILSFIRRQESDLLVPVFTIVEGVSEATKIYAGLLKESNTQAGEDARTLKSFRARLDSIEHGLTAIRNSQYDKETLKIRFGKILDFYISQREALGWPVSNAKKTELAKHVRQSLKNL